MLFDPNGTDRLNCFALVTYIPDPLGSFLDRLREELVPACAPHAHVTVLPPRPVVGTTEEAWEQIRFQIRDFPVFSIEAAEVTVFPVSSVIYIEVGRGRSEMIRMHQLLNERHLAFQEPFTYHPHITLAQGLLPDMVAEAEQLATRRWAEYRQQRQFSAETFTFVQNTKGNRWLDLAELSLKPVPQMR